MSDTQTYLDPTVLSGDSPSGGAFDVTPPMAAPGQQSPNVPAADTSAPAAPDVNGTPAGVSPTTPIGNGQTAGPAAPAQNPPVWRTILQGALWGLANSGGATHFGGGLAAGAAGVMKEKQQQVENAQRAQQLQFESVRAADSHILAQKQALESDSLIKLHAVELTNQQQQANEWADEHGQPRPFIISSDNTANTHTQAVGALTTLAQRNGGSIPQVTTNNSPASDKDPNHKINIYSVSTNDVKSNPNGMADAINTMRQIQAGSTPITPLTPQDILIMGGQKVKGNAAAGAKQMWQEAQQFLLALPPVSDKPAENAAKSANLQQQLDSYKQNPTSNPGTIKLLQTQLNAFNAAAEGQRSKSAQAESQTTLDTAPAKASAAAQETKAKAAAELQTPQGRAAYAKTQQETINAKYKNAEDHQKALFNEGVDPITGERLNLANAPDEALIDGNTSKPIPTKMLSTLKPTQQESNRADFAKSALHSLDIIDQIKAGGKLPNGPITGWTTKALEAAGLNGKDAADAIGLIALTQSAATGAHVGGRFSAQIMDKMNGLLTLNSNDQQFEGQELALRQVMQPYAQQGGRQTVAQYKQETIGTVQTLKNGQKVKVTGLDKNGNFIGQPVK